MQKVFLGFGGNAGDRLNYLKLTVLSVENEIGKILALSSVYETPSWGFCSDNPFLNQVAEIETSLTPEQILEKIAEIEKKLGRERSGEGYQSRTVDIDILFYGKKVIKTIGLTVPHPRLPDRLFVLAPLAEIAPGLIHPESGLMVHKLLETCNDKSEIKRLQ